MTRKLTLSMISYTAVLSIITEASAYDFNAYKPTLDRLYQQGETTIDSGYNLTFEKVDGNADYDFVYQKLNDNNTTTPVYYKVNYEYDGGTTDADVLSKITNYSATDEITGYFKDIKTTYFASPGALHNMSGSSAIKKINADFINNNATNSGYQNMFGGALVNGSITSAISGTIGQINGDFINNSVVGTSTYNSNQAAAGAIFNRGTIVKINGNFIGNSVQSKRFSIGGAILNMGTIGTIEGNFIGNHAYGKETKGGAIYNTTGYFVSGGEVGGDLGTIPTIPQIHGTFIGNYAEADDSAVGGAISNAAGNGAVIPDIYGNFSSRRFEQLFYRQLC